MNPNSISHRLFVAALTHAGQTPAKRSARSAAKSGAKSSVTKPVSAASTAAQKITEWSWSGWQHTTI